MIAKDLIASPRIAWPNANRVLSELSDAIPSDVLAEFAKWSAQLELDEHHGHRARGWLKCWGDLLSWSDDAADLIEILKSALVVKAADWRCWDELHGAFCTAIITGREGTAREIEATLIAAPCEQPHFDQFRYSILFNVARHRPDLGQSAKQWLQTYVDREQRTSHDQYQVFAIRHVESVAEVPIDDGAFRDWVRLRVLENCRQRLEERGPTVHFGLIQFHPMMLQLTWPQFEADLVRNLIAVVDADYVPFVNKFDPIACLAILVSRCPPADSTEIVDATMRWLNDGIKGRDLGHTSPLSSGQMRGAGADAIVTAFAFLLEAIAERHFDLAGEKLAKWVIAEGIRRPMVVVDHTLRTAFHCSIGMRYTNQPLAVALVGIAEGVANAAYLAEPQKTVAGFSRDIIF